jgi:hypothetical protein
MVSCVTIQFSQETQKIKREILQSDQMILANINDNLIDRNKKADI